MFIPDTLFYIEKEANIEILEKNYVCVFLYNRGDANKIQEIRTLLLYTVLFWGIVRFVVIFVVVVELQTHWFCDQSKK